MFTPLILSLHIHNNIYDLLSAFQLILRYQSWPKNLTKEFIRQRFRRDFWTRISSSNRLKITICTTPRRNGSIPKRTAHNNYTKNRLFTFDPLIPVLHTTPSEMLDLRYSSIHSIRTESKTPFYQLARSNHLKNKQTFGNRVR